MPRSLLAAFLIALSALPLLHGAERYPPIHRLTMEEYEATLRYWRAEHPQWVAVERRAMNGQNLPVYLLKITDSSVPDADKQVCLVTALHSGPERTGATGALALADWLLSDDPVAAETRRKQVVLFMPVINPLAMFHTDRFGNEHHVDPYTGNGPKGKVWDVKSLSLVNSEEEPELAAVVSVIDQYRPEVHADLHGIGLQEYPLERMGTRQMYAGQMMTEITGSAYSNFALRPWDWRITEAMIAAGREAGYPSDRFEADAQRTFWGPELAPLGRKLWHGMPLFYTAHYGYAKYHTMMLTQEVAWEESVVARMKALLKIGNGIWVDERTPGYPVDRMRHFVGHYVTAYGKTAAERRDSREELWAKQRDFALGFLYPQTVGRESFVCALTAEAKKALAADDTSSLGANLRKTLGAAAEPVVRFIDAGPEIKLAMELPKAQLLAATEANNATLQHGIGFRLRLSFRDPANLQVQLNGAPLARSATDGFESWFADGFTQIQVNVPPAKARNSGLFLITCSYQPKEPSHLPWMPPAEVQKQCATAKADATPPSFADVPYGAHFRQTMDVWLAQTDKPSPVAFYIHGGGWAAQDKTDVHQHLDVRGLLDSGISVVSINYRLLQDANAAKVLPPVQWPLTDAKRALQYLRSRAGEWNLDKTRIAASGVSAGGCASLWLAMHVDMAEPESPDPVARESSRVQFVAAKAPQPSLDPKLMVEWIPNYVYGGHAFGFRSEATRAEAFPPFLAARDAIIESIKTYSPLEHATPDDPPVFVVYPKQDKPPVKGEPQTDPAHSAVLGLLLRDRLQPLGVPCELRYEHDGLPGEGSLHGALIKALAAPNH